MADPVLLFRADPVEAFIWTVIALCWGTLVGFVLRKCFTIGRSKFSHYQPYDDLRIGGGAVLICYAITFYNAIRSLILYHAPFPTGWVLAIGTPLTFGWGVSIGYAYAARGIIRLIKKYGPAVIDEEPR
jgi:hypothetical protein